jgi:hypothetical protein
MKEFKIVRKMLDGDLLDFLGTYAYNKAKTSGVPKAGTHGYEDSQVPNAPADYGDYVMENLLGFLSSRMEEYTGLTLLPTYSYYRVYKQGNILHPHKDRPSCEISASICLKRNKSQDIWPLYIETNEITKVLLEEGDGLIYRGTEFSHWRDEFKFGNNLAQVFLHYVDANGPHTKWFNDNRPQPNYFIQEY